MDEQDIEPMGKFLELAPDNVYQYILSFDQIEAIIQRTLTKYARENDHFWTRRAGPNKHTHDYAEAWYKRNWNSQGQCKNNYVVFT